MRTLDAWAWRLLGMGILTTTLTASARAEDPPLAEYFRAEVAKIAARPLAGIESAKDWKERRPELQRQLFEMLGLWPLPEKTPLEAKVTGTVDRPDFMIERLIYQSRPGLYVTANLYRPKVVKQPLPAILYVCGHAKVEKNGVIYGCKTHYQHHAAWYAANGYVCLVVDTLQLGELPGMHHGTYRENQWWWQSRGYTPAGVEAWNAIRGIDYLISRPEVDKTKIGVTGRSGGGATSWWVGALDDRVAAVVAVAGITDLQNHVVDGVIKDHCDCMFMVNTYRWDFPLVAALVAPKPLLVENNDADPIFPKDGVLRIFRSLEKIYALNGAADKLALVIGKGGHVDTTEIRHPSFAFMNKWLKGKEEPIVEPDRAVPIEDLKVLNIGEIPPGNLNDKIQETFIPKAAAPPVPDSPKAWKELRETWMKELKSKVFRGWPSDAEKVPLDMKTVSDSTHEGVRIREMEFTSQPGVRLKLWLLTTKESPNPKKLELSVVDEKNWREYWTWLEKGPADDKFLGTFRDLANLEFNKIAWAVFAPRGVGPSAWDTKKDTHVRRRFALIGQTLAGMQTWDVRRAGEVLGTFPECENAKKSLYSFGDMAAPSFWAAVFEPKWDSISLTGLPATVRDGPAFLQLEKVLDMPQALALLWPRRVNLKGSSPEQREWAGALSAKLGKQFWPTIVIEQGKVEAKP